MIMIFCLSPFASATMTFFSQNGLEFTRLEILALILTLARDDALPVHLAYITNAPYLIVCEVRSIIHSRQSTNSRKAYDNLHIVRDNQERACVSKVSRTVRIIVRSASGERERDPWVD